MNKSVDSGQLEEGSDEEKIRTEKKANSPSESGAEWNGYEAV